MNKIKKGFTLAEVLLTLTVIGVVAAITIPNLLNNTNNTELVVKLKKFYAVTNQQLNMMANDYGCIGDLRCTGVFDPADLKKKDGSGNYTNVNEKAGNLISQYFNLAKDCGYNNNSNDPDNNCWADREYYTYDGSGVSDNPNAANQYKFLTADGMSIMLGTGSSNCSSTGPDGTILAQYCADILVDVNGKKEPNRWGRDIFRFRLTGGKGPFLYPWGAALPNYPNDLFHWRKDNGIAQFCTPQSPGGNECASRVMEEGWQMNY